MLGRMFDPIRHALFVVSDDEVFRSINRVLRSCGMAVHRIAGVESAMSVAESIEFDLIVVALPIDGTLGQFLKVMRADGSPCRGIGILVVAPPDHMDEALSHLHRGANRVVRGDADSREMAAAVGALTGVADRLPLRTIVQLNVRLGEARRRVMCQTENLSLSGLLIRGSRSYPPGTRFDFEFSVPGLPRPIRGVGEVVRHTRRPGEHVEGFGATFVSFATDSQRALEHYLNQPIA